MICVNLYFSKTGYVDMWRLKHNQHRNGNLYPTHGLGPVCQAMNINRGDQMDYLTSMSSNDFQLWRIWRQILLKEMISTRNLLHQRLPWKYEYYHSTYC